MAKAMHPATILALSMNGQTPDIHGFPVRLIVPGWDGTSSVKWVVRISAQEQTGTGFFMNPGYRFPKFPLPPGTPARPAELEVIEGMPVKSSIVAPEDQAKVAMGPIDIRGFAWAGENAIERVEVSTDGGSRWRDAQLSPQKLPFAWRTFYAALDASRTRLLHHHVARHRHRGPRTAHRLALESLGLFVERHR